MKYLAQFDIQSWDNNFSEDIQEKAVQALEEGQVLYFPGLNFPLHKEEQQFLNPEIVDPKTKNISYDIRTAQVKGSLCKKEDNHSLEKMMHRYATKSRKLLDHLIPSYKAFLNQARTSFRPVEIFGRKNPSYRKDDTRLHVDSFPANPTKGQRILRVFTNVNPAGKARVWRLGEPFQDVVSKFAPKVSKPFPGIASLLQLLRITKGLRTPYDHYMMNIHDMMKGDEKYQRTVAQEEIRFPSGSTWIVYTDQVSHAAMSGQHVLEQTFHLPRHGLKYASKSPLGVLEAHFKRPLV